MATEAIDKLASAARAELDAAQDEAALEGWRISYLGRKGRLTRELRRLGGLPLEERRAVGAEANRVKRALEVALEAKREELKGQSLAATLESGLLDVTLPGRPKRIGRLHPVTQTLRQMLDIDAADLGGLELGRLPAPAVDQARAGAGEHDLLFRSDVRRAAHHGHPLIIAEVDGRKQQPVRVRMRLHRDDPSDGDQPLVPIAAGMLDRLDFESGHCEPMRQLFRRNGYVNIVGEPLEGDTHRSELLQEP